MTQPQPLAVYTGRYQDTHLSVDFEREAVYLNGAPLKLTNKAYALLAFLVRQSGALVPRDTLLKVVWGYGSDVRTRTLDVHIRRLRKSLGSFGATYLETIFGIGYRFNQRGAMRIRLRGSRLCARTPSLRHTGT
jgi:DNA-binding response OmpR family regulator